MTNEIRGDDEREFAAMTNEIHGNDDDIPGNAKRNALADPQAAHEIRGRSPTMPGGCISRPGQTPWRSRPPADERSAMPLDMIR